MPVKDPFFKGMKKCKMPTPSKKLRAVLWVAYHKKPRDPDFEEWYDNVIEYFIGEVKKTL